MKLYCSASRELFLLLYIFTSQHRILHGGKRVSCMKTALSPIQILFLSHIPLLIHTSHSCNKNPIPATHIPLLLHTSYSCYTHPTPDTHNPLLQHTFHSCNTHSTPATHILLLLHTSHSCYTHSIPAIHISRPPHTSNTLFHSLATPLPPQRGLSESFKDVPLGLDGSTLRSRPQVGGEPLLPRSLSLSGHHTQHARAAHTYSVPHDSKVRL